MDDIRGEVMDLTGLGAGTLARLQDVIHRRIDLVRRGIIQTEELPGLQEASKQLEVAWHKRINWSHRQRLQISDE